MEITSRSKCPRGTNSSGGFTRSFQQLRRPAANTVTSAATPAPNQVKTAAATYEVGKCENFVYNDVIRRL